MKRIASLLVLVALPCVAQVASDPTNAEAVETRRQAFRYYHGEGVKQSNARAVEMFEKAARLGDVESAFDLGKMYQYGMGVAEDPAKAVAWYRDAADHGHRQAQFEASVAYYTGWGVARDKAEAEKWWTIAMANGDSVPEWMRLSVVSAEAKLTSEDIAEGRRRAKEWLAKK